MNWYKIKTEYGTDVQTYAGSSADSLETLAEKVQQGQYIRLDDLVYYENGEIKDWDTLDDRDVPTVLINPAKIIAIQQFKDDPRALPKPQKKKVTSLRRE